MASFQSNSLKYRDFQRLSSLEKSATVGPDSKCPVFLPLYAVISVRSTRFVFLPAIQVTQLRGPGIFQLKFVFLSMALRKRATSRRKPSFVLRQGGEVPNSYGLLTLLVRAGEVRNGERQRQHGSWHQSISDLKGRSYPMTDEKHPLL